MSSSTPRCCFVPGALLIPFLTGWVRKAYLLLVPALAIAAVAAMEPGTYGEGTFLGQAVLVARVDKLSVVFAAVFTIMALIGMVYALHLERAGQHVAAFVYVGSALGVVFAGDYLTLFLFWEGMAFASAYLVFAQGGAPAIGAGFRYLMVHITGGVVLLGGIVLYGRATGSLLFGPVEGELGTAAYLILAGLHAQRRGAAAQRLADRRLPGGDRHRGGVHERLHHQDRGLRAGARVSGDRAPGLVRHGDGDLRRDLRGAGERLPAAARLSHRQPGGLHGGGRRHRHRDGAERRRQPRLRAYPLQGAACSWAPGR